MISKYFYNYQFQYDNNLIFSDKKYQYYLPHSLKLNHDWATKINGIFFNKPQPKQKHKIVKAEEKEFSEVVILKPNTKEIIEVKMCGVIVFFISVVIVLMIEEHASFAFHSCGSEDYVCRGRTVIEVFKRILASG